MDASCAAARRAAGARGFPLTAQKRIGVDEGDAMQAADSAGGGLGRAHHHSPATRRQPGRSPSTGQASTVAQTGMV